MRATEADREKARVLLGFRQSPAHVKRVAQALADERANALQGAADDLHKLMPELDWDDWLRERANGIER